MKFAASQSSRSALATQLQALENLLQEKIQLLNNLQIQLAKDELALQLSHQEIERLKRESLQMTDQLKAEFKNLANEILEDKSRRFTIQNQENISAILTPLGENLKEFKKVVAESYNLEAKERFSLGEKVKELSELNKIMSEETRNLTKALKGEAKTQGDWGEMILESILEKSGLRKNEEYFLQEELKNEEGKPLISDSEGKKMRPDAIINYPDKRTVIIDSKVSLNAFIRSNETDDPDQQKKELENHVAAIKKHILDLSSKAYDDYDKSLDFVLMFIPSEPAYIAALQRDSNLWNFAYEKRILLMNPTNLITSLKLIVDLWKREYQNKNALAIADRGAKLYDKFAGFVDQLETIGDTLDKAKTAYSKAHSVLKSGPGNLIRQAEELKSLGIKSKKSIKTDSDNELPEEILD
jgi:DNA recombination protein RmuC